MTEDTRLTDFLEVDERDSNGGVEPAAVRNDAGDDDTDRHSEDVLGSDADTTIDADTDTGTDADDGSPTGDADASVEPATTYAWGTYDCESCGSATERVWIDDTGVDDGEGDGGYTLVCESCKRW